MTLYKMIEIYLKYDNMHTFGVVNVFICINNHVNSCIISMLSKIKRTPESHTTMQVTPQPLQTSNSFDVLVGLKQTKISAPTTVMDSHPIDASPLHGPSQIPTCDQHPSRLPTAPSPITHPPLH